MRRRRSRSSARRPAPAAIAAKPSCRSAACSACAADFFQRLGALAVPPSGREHSRRRSSLCYQLPADQPRGRGGFPLGPPSGHGGQTVRSFTGGRGSASVRHLSPSAVAGSPPPSLPARLPQLTVTPSEATRMTPPSPPPARASRAEATNKILQALHGLIDFVSEEADLHIASYICAVCTS